MRILDVWVKKKIRSEFKQGYKIFCQLSTKQNKNINQKIHREKKKRDYI